MYRILLGSLLLFAANALPQAKPNFSGTWKVNIALSDYGPLPKPTSQTNKVNHQEPSLTQIVVTTSSGGEASTDAKYTTDGRECVNSIEGNKLASKVRWEGSQLVFDSVLKTDGGQLSIVDRWSMHGKNLQVLRHLQTPEGQGDLKLIFDKQ